MSEDKLRTPKSIERLTNLCEQIRQDGKGSAGAIPLEEYLPSLESVCEDAGRVAELEHQVEQMRKQQEALIQDIGYTRRELDKKIEEISLVRLVAETGIRSLLSRNPLQLILEHVCRLTGAESGSAMLFSREERRLHVAAQLGEDHTPPYERSYKLGEGIARWIDQTLSDSEPDLDPEKAEGLLENDSEHGSVLCYPLIIDHSLVGVICLGHSSPNAFTTETGRIMFIIATQVALAVYNAQLISLYKQQGDGSNSGEDGHGTLAERVNALLDIAQIEKGSLEYHKERLRLRDLLTRLRPSFRSRLREKSLRLQVRIPKRIPVVEADGERIQQVLEVLIEESIRRTPEQGNIVLIVTIEKTSDSGWKAKGISSPSGKFLLFSLSDSSGLNAAVLREKLNAGPVADIRNVPMQGTQLSYFLAREIIANHGGRIWIEEEDPMSPACCFTLPVVS